MDTPASDDLTRVRLPRRLAAALARFARTGAVTAANLARLEGLGLIAPDLFDHGIYKLTACGRSHLEK